MKRINDQALIAFCKSFPTYTVTEVAHIFGHPHGSIQKAAKRLGIKFPSKRGKRNDLKESHTNPTRPRNLSLDGE